MTTCIPSFASTLTVTDAKKELKLTRNTVITQENFDQVLMKYGIDPSNVKQKDNSAGNNATMTVGEFEDALNYLKNQPKKISMDNVESVENKLIAPQGMVSPADTIYVIHGNAYLSSTTMMSSTWGMTRGCTAEWICYSDTGVREYVQANSPYASIYTVNPGLPLTKYQIDRVNSISASCTPDLVTVYSDVEVGMYMTIGIDPLEYEILVTTSQVTGYSTFNTSHIKIS